MARSLTLEDLARSSLVGFSGYVDAVPRDRLEPGEPPSFWVAHPHARFVAEKLEDVERGRIKKLMVFLPGQHGKSTLVSRNFPAWYLGKHPDARIILATYGASYAALWGRRARNLVQRFGPSLFGVEVSDESGAADHWEIKGRRGTLHTAGVDGAVTGHSADGVIIDDPVKSREEAESPVYREKTIEWYKSSVVNDLAGWLLATEPGEWEVVELPALAEKGDALGRAEGEALCPTFVSVPELHKIRRTVGSYVWASMWRQKPTPLGGGLFKRHNLTRYRLDKMGHDPLDAELVETTRDGTIFTPRVMDRFITVDTATSEDKRNCRTAISSWGYDPRGRLNLLEVDMDWIEAPEIMRRIVDMCRRWETISWIEENSTSKHLLQFMESERVPFRVLTPGSRSKFTRALPASALWEQGRVMFPEDADWLDAVERVTFSYTGADGDDADFVDTLAYAARVVMEEIEGGGMNTMPDTAPKPRPYLPSGYATRRPDGF
jgi:predicted phage terminase large subunit-like protein